VTFYFYLFSPTNLSIEVLPGEQNPALAGIWFGANLCNRFSIINPSPNPNDFEKYFKIKSTPQLQQSSATSGNFGSGHYPRFNLRIISHTSLLFNIEN